VTPEDFRRLGHRLIDWIADYRARIEEFPVMSRSRPGEIRAMFPPEPPAAGEPLDSILADLDRIVLPGVTHWNHPSFFAYFPSNSSLSSVLADLVSSGLGVQGMSWQTSPAATEIEEVVMDWLRQMLGLPPDFSGVIQDTASTATLIAMLCARERATGFSQNRGGMAGEAGPVAVYASSQAHSSVEKAALLAGFGKDNIRLIDTDDSHALRLDRLEEAIEADRRDGLRAAAVVATIGTTGTMAVDPLLGIAEIARRHSAWLHVDAAMAGSAMILPECRSHWNGIERADSLVVNPHKWLGVGFDLTAYYVREPQHLIRVMSTNPSYLVTAHDAEVKNFRDWGIALGRRFRALKLWFLLREQGVAGLQLRLRRDLENAKWLAGRVDASPGWERVAPVAFQTVCVRHRTADNLAIASSVNAGGRAYITPAVLKGRQMLRLSVGAEATERRHVEALWEDLQAAAANLAVPPKE
jgi:aromatic-L-amino-acid/L-tryptophan decarboxylase